MATDLLRIEANERIDIRDLQYSIDDSFQGNVRQTGDQLFANPSGQRVWIISGFAPAKGAGEQVQVTKGRALLGQREGAQVFYGALTSDGDASQTIDVSAFGNGTYGIYVRFEYRDGDIDSRIFWNSAGNGSEFAKSIATRRKANWSLRIELTNPGAEWTKLGEVDVSGAAITEIRDTRPMYFEGVANYTVYPAPASLGSEYLSGWSTDGGGGANDRDDDRKLNGVTDFQTFTGAMRQSIEDIKGRGLRNWWDRDIGGMNIGFDANPVEDRVAVGDDEFYLRNLSPSPTSSPVLWFQTTPQASITYSRNTNTFDFTIGAAGATLSSTLLSVAGKVKGTGTSGDNGGDFRGGAGAAGSFFLGGDGNTNAIVSQGVGTGAGLLATGGSTGIGIYTIGGVGGAEGIIGQGTGLLPGGHFYGGASGGYGVKGNGAGTGAGVQGVGGLTNGIGVEGFGSNLGPGGSFANSGVINSTAIFAYPGANGIGISIAAPGTGPSIIMQPKASDPSQSFAIGAMYVNTSGKPKMYNGNIWDRYMMQSLAFPLSGQSYDTMTGSTSEVVYTYNTGNNISYNLIANSITGGSVINLRGHVNAAGPGTKTLKVRFGGLTGATAFSTLVPLTNWYFEADIQFSVAGGAVDAHITTKLSNSIGQLLITTGGSFSGTVNTTIANEIVVTVQNSDVSGTSQLRRFYLQST